MRRRSYSSLRANEARSFKNKYDHDFTVEPASSAQETVDFVHRVLKEERGIVILARPLEASTSGVDTRSGRPTSGAAAYHSRQATIEAA